MSCGRGGARHFAKPLVDADVLFSILSANEELVADLGSYEHLSKTYAPDPKGLLHCLDLWKALVKAEPSGSCHMRPMRQALLSLLVKKPHLNTTTHSGEVWANLRVERITCILMHVRKVKRDGLEALLAAKLSRDEMALVDHGLQLLSLPPLEKGGTSDALGKADALRKASALEKAESSKALGEDLAIVPFVSEKKQKRKLQENSSDPSLDGLGFPKMFASPEQLGKAASQAASPADPQRKKRRTGQRVLENSQNLHSSLGYGGKTVPNKKRPAASLEKVAKADKNLKESKRKKKEFGKDSSKKRQEWFKLYTTWPKCPERGYITGIQKEGGKKILIVEVTKKMSLYYQDIVAEIRDALEKESITKEEAVSMRSELLLAYNSAI